jgi:hypothetical protein
LEDDPEVSVVPSTPKIPDTPRSVPSSAATGSDPVLSTPLAATKSSASQSVLRTPLQSPQVGHNNGATQQQTPNAHSTPPLQLLAQPTPSHTAPSTPQFTAHAPLGPANTPQMSAHTSLAAQNTAASYSVPRPQNTHQRTQSSVPPLIITPQLSGASVPPLRHHVPQVLVPMHTPDHAHLSQSVPTPHMGQHVNHMPASVLQPVKHSQRAVSLPMTRATHPLMSLDPQRVVTVNGKTYISLDGEIGKGQSSRVHKVVGEDMQIYAIKEVKFRDLDDPCIPGYLQEVELLKTLQGEPFIIK